ncbi:MAG: hypothetical protein BWY51_00868 [Parcubacteria group bacterium ADurb.Bin316]|nr:MAG: hypothetical protein BWY51_00868 [Parcubacteria group bacterium ADurb.Bin316]HOZ56485.1 hypothetical protein [bacterium]
MRPETKKEKQKNTAAFLLIILHRYFFIIAILVFLAIILSGFIFLIQPKYDSITEKIRVEEEKKTQELAELQAYSEKLRNYRNEYNQISSADKAKIDAMIAGSYLPEDVFSEMEKLVSSRGLILNSIEVNSLLSDNKNGSLGEAVIKLSISGINYEGLKQLLAIIESSLRLADVKKVNFSPSQNTVNLEISTYFLN